MAYSKLHSSIVNSSLWVEPDATRLLFITLLAMCDADGMVYGSRGGLARLANIRPDEAPSAWLSLMSPDPDSSDKVRAPENEGRRVEEVSGGFRLLNFAYYRGLRNEDDRREQNRQAQAKHRQRQSASVSLSQPESATVSHGKPLKAHTEADTEAEALNTVPTALVASAAPNRLSPCPTGELVSLYHQHLPMLPRVEILNDTRRRRIAARWREVIGDPEIAKSDDPKSAALAWFAWFFEHAAQSPFLTGKSKDWRASFDFLIAPTNFAKVAEGNYHRTAA